MRNKAVARLQLARVASWKLLRLISFCFELLVIIWTGHYALQGYAF